MTSQIIVVPSVGPKGDPGPVGPAGPTGPTGPAGLSAPSLMIYNLSGGQQSRMTTDGVIHL